MGNSTTARLLRSLFAAAMLGVGFCPASTPPASATPPVDPLTQSVTYREVRLRKLHLARPDLIQYPIVVEYYC